MARAPRINEPQDMMDLRRANLMVLTDFQGGKTGVGRLMGKSPANISHVLHGKKKFTRLAAAEFEQAVGLPEGWFDEPRTPEDVPDEVKASILAAFEQQAGVSSSTPVKPRVVKPAGRPTPRPSVPATGAALTLGVSAIQPGAAAKAAEELVGGAAPVALARKVVSQPAVPEQLAIEMNQLNGGQAKPIAQALVRVIILLSRGNELSEDKCLRLLNEVTMMATPQA